MKKTLGIAALFVLCSLMLITTTWAGPIPPADKLMTEASVEEPEPYTGKWYLRNGAFDESWDDNVPRFWQLYAGDADAYGALDFLGLDASGGIVDNAFAFQIINNEVRGDQNAYLYQTIVLPQGDYWLNVHSTIYGVGTGTQKAGGYTAGDYTYMAYYALVPKADVILDGAFTPGTVDASYWKELWPFSTACREDVANLGAVDQLEDCDYVKRAETVSVTEGEYVFILRAELKWPDWRASAYYVFDDLQIIAATPTQDNWNACVTSYCLEGLVRPQHGED